MVRRAGDVEPRDGFQIWMRFDDGTAGIVDLHDLAGRGVFKVWEDRRVFESLRIRGAVRLSGPANWLFVPMRCTCA